MAPYENNNSRAQCMTLINISSLNYHLDDNGLQKRRNIISFRNDLEIKNSAQKLSCAVV